MGEMKNKFVVYTALFGDYEWCLYVDANIAILSNPMNLTNLKGEIS
mgnify:CR=1 FL=1